MLAIFVLDGHAFENFDQESSVDDACVPKFCIRIRFSCECGLSAVCPGSSRRERSDKYEEKDNVEHGCGHFGLVDLLNVEDGEEEIFGEKKSDKKES